MNWQEEYICRNAPIIKRMIARKYRFIRNELNLRALPAYSRAIRYVLNQLLFVPWTIETMEDIYIACVKFREDMKIRVARKSSVD